MLYRLYYILLLTGPVLPVLPSAQEITTSMAPEDHISGWQLALRNLYREVTICYKDHIIPTDLTPFMAVQYVHLKHASLSDNSNWQGFTCLRNLIALDVSHNALTKIPRAWASLGNLEELDISSNPMRNGLSLRTLQPCSKLHTLAAKQLHTTLEAPAPTDRQIIRGIGALSHLTYLDISKNNLSCENADPLHALSQLKQLLCNSTHLKIDKLLPKLSTLECLELDTHRNYQDKPLSPKDLNNLLRHKHFPHLQYVSISRLYLRVLPAALAHLKNLIGLKAEGNPLDDISVLKDLGPCIKSVILANCGLKLCTEQVQPAYALLQKPSLEYAYFDNPNGSIWPAHESLARCNFEFDPNGTTIREELLEKMYFDIYLPRFGIEQPLVPRDRLSKRARIDRTVLTCFQKFHERNSAINDTIHD